MSDFSAFATGRLSASAVATIAQIRQQRELDIDAEAARDGAAIRNFPGIRNHSHPGKKQATTGKGPIGRRERRGLVAVPTLG